MNHLDVSNVYYYRYCCSEYLYPLSHLGTLLLSFRNIFIIFILQHILPHEVTYHTLIVHNKLPQTTNPHYPSLQPP